jgi:hypothetical protein
MDSQNMQNEMDWQDMITELLAVDTAKLPPLLVEFLELLDEQRARANAGEVEWLPSSKQITHLHEIWQRVFE